MPKGTVHKTKKSRWAAAEPALEAREQGATLRAAAAAAGLHVATLCRWRRADRRLDKAFRDAETAASMRCYRFPPRRPSVPVHPACPRCGAGVEVRNAGGWPGPPFWRCRRYPYCRWAKWQPRYPRDCPACGGPRYWSHSRKSVSCPACGQRWQVG